MKAVILVLAALFAIANAGSTYTDTIHVNGGSGQIKFDRTTNVTVDSGDTSFDYRQTTFVGLSYFAFYSSVKVTGSGSGGSASVNADAIVGAAAAPLALVNPHPPASILAYFHAEADANIGSQTFSISGTASGAGVAAVYDKVEEVDASGNVVSTTYLADISWTAATAGNSPDPEIKFYTWTGTASKFTVFFTVCVSSVTGILNVGGAPITPKNTETFLEFDSIGYSSSTNHLRLTAYTAAASATANFAASGNTLLSGAGPSQVYFHFNGEAVIDGSSKAVTVSGVSEGDSGYSISDLGHNTIQATLTGNASLSLHVRKVTIDFPAGASSISYDPAMGFDAPKSYSAAGSLSASAIFVFAAAFAALLL